MYLNWKLQDNFLHWFLIHIRKSRLVRLAGYVARMRRQLNGTDLLGDLCVGRRTVLQIKDVCMCVLTKFGWLEMGSSVGFLGNRVMNLRFPQEARRFLTNWGTVSFSGRTLFYVRGPFEKFVDSPYYFESELCGGAVTVCFSKCIPWQAMHFLQRSTHFSKTCRRPLISSKFLASELPFHGWKSPEIALGAIWTVWRMF
jgi:hypothetical protein